jgi:hypothetical protein
LSCLRSDRSRGDPFSDVGPCRWFQGDFGACCVGVVGRLEQVSAGGLIGAVEEAPEPGGEDGGGDLPSRDSGSTSSPKNAKGDLGLPSGPEAPCTGLSDLVGFEDNGAMPRFFRVGENIVINLALIARS